MTYEKIRNKYLERIGERSRKKGGIFINGRIRQVTKSVHLSKLAKKLHLLDRIHHGRPCRSSAEARWLKNAAEI